MTKEVFIGKMVNGHFVTSVVVAGKQIKRVRIAGTKPFDLNKEDDFIPGRLLRPNDALNITLAQTICKGV